ncbi:hypothetical protein DIPPA_32730 [Diplonema papillatum]|nr:hypothetical protein DIPPA_32730 [Diplonema papillatum]
MGASSCFCLVVLALVGAAAMDANTLGDFDYEEPPMADPCSRVGGLIEDCETIHLAIKLFRMRSSEGLTELLIDRDGEVSQNTKELIDRFIRILVDPNHKYA